MTQPHRERKICGFINVLKPPGMTSAQVVGRVRRLLQGEKVGHAGTLDPEAAGVLPLMVGKATRLFDYMQQKQKAYVAEVSFGLSTDTQDAQGEPAEVGNNFPNEEDIRKSLSHFEGTLLQKPPSYSAIKQNGKRLYQLARDGRVIDVPARPVEVHHLRFVGMIHPDGVLLAIQSGKGFYVRTLCHDLGEALGCPAHMRFLLRTQAGVFTLSTAYTLEMLENASQDGDLEKMLLPPQTVLMHLTQAMIPDRLRHAALTGGRLPLQQLLLQEQNVPDEGAHLCLWVDGQVLAVGRRTGDAVKICTWLGD